MISEILNPLAGEGPYIVIKICRTGKLILNDSGDLLLNRQNCFCAVVIPSLRFGIYTFPALNPAFLNPLPSLSNSAAHMIGKQTVASTKTSPKRPPSSGGTNLPQETASEYGEPESPPQ